MSTLKDSMTNSTANCAPELDKILEAANALGAESVRQQILEVEERTREQRFYVACVGQFKRGKSTLLDALIGVQILPTGILPVTAVPTVVRHGSALAARIRMESGEWKDIQPQNLKAYVSEEGNPGNRERISAVEVFADSPLLASGMCLVDTPGLGSIFENNSAATRAFIPHIDVAILVIGADPPLSADELSLAEAVAAQVRDIIVVLNKADRASESERLLAKDFARLILEKRLRRDIGPIGELSATEWLESGKPTRDGQELLRNLHELAGRSGATLAQAAWERAVRRLCLELRGMTAERLGALTRPVAESKERLAMLNEQMNAARSSLRDLTPLLRAEEQQMAQVFAEHRESFVAAALPPGITELHRRIGMVAFRSGLGYRRTLMRTAQAIARDTLLAWKDQEQAFAGELYSKMMARFTAVAQDYLHQLSKSIAGVNGTELSDKLGRAELTYQSEFRFYDIIRVARPVSPFGLLRDLALTIVRRRHLFTRDAEKFLEKLLLVNSSRVENDFKERVATSRHKLEKQIRTLLSEMVHQAEVALQSAQELMEHGRGAVEEEVRRLNKLEQALRDMV